MALDSKLHDKLWLTNSNVTLIKCLVYHKGCKNLSASIKKLDNQGHLP